MYPCDILGKAVVYGIYNDSYKAESAFKLQSKSSDSVNRGTYRRSYGNDSCVGSCKIQFSGEADNEWNNRASICTAYSGCGYCTYTSDNNQRLAWRILCKIRNLYCIHKAGNHICTYIRWNTIRSEGGPAGA